MSKPSSTSLRCLFDNIEAFLKFQQELGIDTVEISPEHLAALRSARPECPSPSRTAPVTSRPGPASGTLPASDEQPPRGNSPAEQLEAIAEELRQSTFCPLKKNAIHTVPGQGNASPDIVFIGEAPGQEEDQQGLAFVGPSGEILTRIITAMGITREEVWIGNIVKWRPPHNRAPTPEEIAGCMPFLIRQLEILRPKVIVCLGGVATKAMLDTTVGITKLRGEWNVFRGIPLMPTYHPSFLLRSQSRQQKERYWEVWSDMEAVLVKLGMPIPGTKK